MGAFTIPTACEHKIRVRHGMVASKVVCGKDARYVDGEGEVRTVLMWSRGRFIGSECWLRVSRTLFEQGHARFGDLDSWKRYEESDAEQKAMALSRRQFAHALSETAPERRGGLVRADNSGMLGWSLRRVR